MVTISFKHRPLFFKNLFTKLRLPEVTKKIRTQRRLLHLKKRLAKTYQKFRSNPRLFWGTLAGLGGVGITAALVVYLSLRINDHDFTRGVLALNTDKSSYVAGETVLFQMASLNSEGGTLCNSNLELTITVPKQKKKTVLKYQANQIIPTSTCQENNNVTNEPDYISRFVTTTPGTYRLTLKNLDTGKRVKSSFEVREQRQPVTITRSGAIRINPEKSDRYPMILQLTATEDFKGAVMEHIPAGFKVIWYGKAKVDNSTISWEVELKAGESKELIYEYAAPEKSPEFYTFGPLDIKLESGKIIFRDSTAWQLAINNDTK